MRMDIHFTTSQFAWAGAIFIFIRHVHQSIVL